MVTNKPLVSVIIPAFNAEEWIKQTVQSVINQIWKHLEIIVVDDGSSDRTIEIIERIGDSRVSLMTQRHSGAASARNRGFAQCRGDLIQFLDADDILSVDKLSLQIEALARNPTHTVASCSWAHFASSTQLAVVHPEPVWLIQDTVDWLVHSLSGDGMMQPAAWLTPRAIADAAGPWNETLTLHDDGEYFARVLVNATRNVFVPGATVYYRKVPESLSRRRSRKAIESAFSVCRELENILLAVRDDGETRSAIATQYARFGYEFAGTAPQLAKQAVHAIRRLGSGPKAVGGRSFRHVVDLLGIGAAIQLRTLLKRE